MISYLRLHRFGALITLFVILTIGGAVLFFHHSGPQDDHTDKPVALEFVADDVTYVKRLALSQSLAISGNLDAKNQASIKAKAAADVKMIAVREGDFVHAGQVLAQLDTADLQAHLAEKISTRDSARAQFELAEKNRATNHTLLEKSFISQNAFDSTESTYKANRAALEAADAEVEIARIALQNATVVAPISGTIAKRSVKLGERPALDQVMFSIVDIDSLELEALVPASEVTRLRHGMTAQLRADGLPDRSFSAMVDRISPATEPGTRSVLVFLTVQNTEHVLRSGMYADGQLALGASNALPALPISAIQYDAGQPIIWTLESNVLTRRKVELGVRDAAAGLVEVRNPPAETVPVLASHFDMVKEGATASVHGAAPASPVASKSLTTSMAN